MDKYRLIIPGWKSETLASAEGLREFIQELRDVDLRKANGRRLELQARQVNPSDWKKLSEVGQ